MLCTNAYRHGVRQLKEANRTQKRHTWSRSDSPLTTPLFEHAFGEELDQELVGVARDLAAPNSARADAYEKLMHVAGNEIGDWTFTAEDNDEWVKIAPTYDRASKRAPRIADRRSRG